jgi:CII-binding regulator of phage lambda lysogenization HflD
MKIETIHNNAHKLTQINEVSTRIDQLKADIKEKSDFLSTINVERQAKLYEEVISAVKERAKIEGIGIEHTYLSVFIKAIEKQCDLLGLEAPKKSEMKITNAAKIVVSPEGEKPEIENGD